MQHVCETGFLHAFFLESVLILKITSLYLLQKADKLQLKETKPKYMSL